MGAALLKTPEVASDIVKTLRRNLPCAIAVTCKIRMLPTLAETIEFARMCEKSGADAITLHARQPHERPNQRAHWDVFKPVKEALRVPLIANGDFLRHDEAIQFQDSIGVEDGIPLMFARGALWDPSIFLRAEDERKRQKRSSQGNDDTTVKRRRGGVMSVEREVASCDDGGGDTAISDSSATKNELRGVVDNPSSTQTRVSGGRVIDDDNEEVDESGSDLNNCTATATRQWQCSCHCARCAEAPRVSIRPSAKTDIIRHFLRTAICCGTIFQSMKWSVQEMVSQHSDIQWKSKIHSTKSTRDMLILFDLVDWYEVQIKAKGWEPRSVHSLTYYKTATFGTQPEIQTDEDSYYPSSCCTPVVRAWRQSVVDRQASLEDNPLLFSPIGHAVMN